jgi:probable phosphoglycerate mutase
MRRVVVVRHGETDWNLRGRMQGWAPVPLNGTGREQADDVGRYLAREYDVDRVVSSGLERTHETTELVTAHVDAPVTCESAWRERHIGVYQGLDYEDVVERFPAFALGETGIEAADRTPESGESLLEVRERVVEAWRALLDGDDASGTAAGDGDGDSEWETALVVTHGGPIKLLLGHLEGMDARTSLREHAQSNCAVNEIRVDGDDAEVVRENVTGWADGTDAGAGDPSEDGE